MKKYFSKLLQTFSGSLKAVRVVLKRLPHSLRSFAMTDFLLSGSLKVFLILFIVFSANSAFADEISSTANYLPGGQYRMFGGGRGDVEKVKNKIKKIHTTSNFGPLRTDTDNYSGSVYYEQRFYNHPIEEHGSFSHSNSIRVIDAHGSIRNGYVGYTNVKISGSEVHPDDAYDGGDHPYDAYTYHVDGTVKTTSIQPIELPKLPNPFDKNKENADKGNQNNGLPENSSADANDRTRDLTATGDPSLPNTEADGNNGFNNNGEVPLPQASGWKDILDGGLGFADGLAQSFFDEAKTTADAVTHPVDTTKNLANAAKTVAGNPTVAGKAVQQTFTDAIDEKVANYDKAQTAYQRGFEVGTIPVAIVGAVLPSSAAGKAKAVTEIAKAVDKASDAANAAKKVEKAVDTAGAGSKATDFSKTKIETGKQNKHIEGTNEYNTELANGRTNKSLLTTDPNSLTSQFGTGKQVGNIPVGQPGSKEIIDFGKNIGYHVDKDTGVKTLTTEGTVHYSKKRGACSSQLSVF